MDRTNDPWQDKWDQRHAEAAPPSGPAGVLRDYTHLLPQQGRALDLACGLGRNALFLAGRGLEVDAWDFSPVAIRRLREAASAAGLAVNAETRDVVAAPPPSGRYDVIVVSYFLERPLAPQLVQALRPGGLLYYQTFIQEAVDSTGPQDPAFRLGENELLDLFRALRVLSYREEGRVGDLSGGLRNEAMLVAMRRLPTLSGQGAAGDGRPLVEQRPHGL